MILRNAASFFFLPALAGMVLCAGPTNAAMEDYPEVVLKALDKSTARTTTITAKVGESFEYGPLNIRIQSCRKNPPIETPESAAFIQVWEVPPETGKSEWVFSGWMFASSPALSAMDHPVYDIWVLDCTGKEEETTPPKIGGEEGTGREMTDAAGPDNTDQEGLEVPDSDENPEEILED